MPKDLAKLKYKHSKFHIPWKNVALLKHKLEDPALERLELGEWLRAVVPVEEYQPEEDDEEHNDEEARRQALDIALFGKVLHSIEGRRIATWKGQVVRNSCGGSAVGGHGYEVRGFDLKWRRRRVSDMSETWA
jgi:hypothetical protein